MRVRIGDIVEIPIRKGLAYTQNTHKHKKWGNLIRVFQPLFKEQPKGFEFLVDEKVCHIAFVPLQAMVNQGIFKIVTNCPISKESSDFPMFKAWVQVEDPNETYGITTSRFVSGLSK